MCNFTTEYFNFYFAVAQDADASSMTILVIIPGESEALSEGGVVAVDDKVLLAELLGVKGENLICLSFSAIQLAKLTFSVFGSSHRALLGPNIGTLWDRLCGCTCMYNQRNILGPPRQSCDKGASRECSGMKSSLLCTRAILEQCHYLASWNMRQGLTDSCVSSWASCLRRTMVSLQKGHLKNH